MGRMIQIKASSMNGFNNLINKLKRAIPEVAEDTVKTSVMKIEADARENCPVDTGRLRDSINSRIEQQGDDITGIVSTDVEYAGYVEYGTSKMSAQPYMTPAFNDNKDDIGEYFIEKLKSKVR